MAFPKEGAFAGTDRQVFTNGSPGRFSDRQQRRNRQLLGRVDHRYLHEGGKDVVVINASARLIQAGADAVVVAGAAVAGIAERLRTRLPVPLLNGIACAVDQAETWFGLACVSAPLWRR